MFAKTGHVVFSKRRLNTCQPLWIILYCLKENRQKGAKGTEELAEEIEEIMRETEEEEEKSKYSAETEDTNMPPSPTW